MNRDGFPFRRRRLLVTLITAGLLAVALFVAREAARTLADLESVEAARDAWQRPADIVAALSPGPGDVVADLGCGAGYFTLRLAPVVGKTGAIIAVDVRREPLAFLWIRARRRGYRQVKTVLGTDDDPRIPAGRQVSAVLIANTYHELTNAPAILSRLRQRMRPAGRLVITDRRLRDATEMSRDQEMARHRISPSTVAAEVRAAGFRIVSQDERFIDRPDDDPWWLLVGEAP